ncbi:MAG: gamma-glutamyl-gamma-aminobutyrate hydrolase family protein [Gemmiger sp.]|nr:gamma-glutamyl-gamma-aminobutyrate hydrolase family protein [Gemmiger sp.]
MQNYTVAKAGKEGCADETVDWIDADRGCGAGQFVDAAGVHAGAGGSRGVGMMLPLTDDAATLQELVSRVDGILLTGGNDVAPALYGEQKETFCGENDPLRDRMETRLIELALQADKPIFGICRGLQILNTVLGGTLYQDLKTQTGTALTHSMDKPYDRTVHEVTVLPGTPLGELYGPGPMAVNSRHHQGIKALAPALRAQAVAPDGLIEAVYLPEYRFVQAVQWHPEHRWQAAESQSILRAFVESCRG